MQEIIIPNTDITKEKCKELKIVRNGDITCYYVKLVNNGGKCPSCGKYVTRPKDIILKKIHHDQRQIIYYYARRLKCDCGKTFYEPNPFVKDEINLSENLVKNVLEELKGYNHTFLEVSKRFNISVTKTVEIFDTHVQIKRKALREVISIDEFYFSRHSRNKYAFLIIGLNGEIIDIIKSRKKSSLLDYFKYIPQEERARVKYVTMDMNENYKGIVKRRFEDVTICIDSFHVIKLLFDSLDNVRKKVMHRYDNRKNSDEYYLLKHKKYVLFKDDLNNEYVQNKHFHLLMNDTDYLNEILKIDPELTKIYQEVKRYLYFNRDWNLYTKEEALIYLNNYIDECFNSNFESLRRIGSTLNNWKKEIANSFIPYTKHNGEITRLSNGKIEGKNSYIKKILYLANGYSNFERFRNRAMYVENLNEKYSEEKLKNNIKRTYKKKEDTTK